jgi:hypothetical protein
MSDPMDFVPSQASYLSEPVGLYSIVDRPDNAATNWNAGVGRAHLGLGFSLRRTRQFGKSWMADAKARRDFLAKRFPAATIKQGRIHCHRNFLTCKCRVCHQIRQASRWAIIMRDWFVRGWSDSFICDSFPGLFKSRCDVSNCVRMIQFAIKGLRLDGRKHTGRKRGRPMKERRRLIRASLR